MKRVSDRQLEVLSIIGEDGADGWGEVWTLYDSSNRHVALDFRNFDRVSDALLRHGLVRHDNRIELTDAGRAALVAAGKLQQGPVRNVPVGEATVGEALVCGLLPTREGA